MHGTLRYDPYRVLGVERSASRDQIKKAYRTLAKRCHPDRNSDPRAKAIFHEVQTAYEQLIDPDQRMRSDEQLRNYRPARPSVIRPAVRKGSTDRPVNRFAFIGLHVTGLCFGLILISGILIGITFHAWPSYLMVFCLPGIAVIPDSLAGLRK